MTNYKSSGREMDFQVDEQSDMARSSTWRLAAGMTHLSKPLYTRHFAEAIIHEDFKNFGKFRSNLPNDIAVLKLNKALPIGKKTGYITWEEDQNFDNTTCCITGWGRTDKGFPDKLHHVSVNVLSVKECNKWFQSGQIVLETHMCSYDPINRTGDACTLDSGGPMTCFDQERPILAGVISWGDSLCAGIFPSVYTKVSYYSEWIKDKTGINREYDDDVDYDDDQNSDADK